MVSQRSQVYLCPVTVEGFREGQSVFDWPDKETESGLWQFPEVCPARPSTTNPVPLCPAFLQLL